MSFKVFALAAFASACLAGAADAAVITASSAVGATTSPFALTSLGNAGINGFVSSAALTVPGATITFSPDASTPMAGLYDGNVAFVASSPYNSTRLTAQNYVVAEPNDPVTISFTTPQSAFNLLWGSVDTSNSLTASFDGGAPVTITGSQIDAMIGSGFSYGSPAFVTISGTGQFSTVTLISSAPAFEFVPGAPTIAAVPEPASFGLLGAGLAGIGFVRRRRAAALA